MIDPQQELFSAIKIALEQDGYTVYDGILPPDGTPYPFIYLGDCQQTDRELKNAVFGSVYPTVHVWSDNPRKRGTLSGMLLAIKNACRNIERTSNFTWNLRNVTQRIMADTSTKTPLMHGVIELEYQFS